MVTLEEVIELPVFQSEFASDISEHYRSFDEVDDEDFADNGYTFNRLLSQFKRKVDEVVRKADRGDLTISDIVDYVKIFKETARMTSNADIYDYNLVIHNTFHSNIHSLAILQRAGVFLDFLSKTRLYSPF